MTEHERDSLRFCVEIQDTERRRAHLEATAKRLVLEADGCEHESVTTPDGCGAYCRFCGETLA